MHIPGHQQYQTYSAHFEDIPDNLEDSPYNSKDDLYSDEDDPNHTETSSICRSDSEELLQFQKFLAQI